MKKKTQHSRRNFLLQSATLAAGISIIPRHVMGRGFLAPSDQLTKAIIGVGGMGRGHIEYANTRVVAICDVDTTHLAAAEKMIPGKIKTFHDYKELIALPEVDIVHIATPPHWHALMSIAAVVVPMILFLGMVFLRFFIIGFGFFKFSNTIRTIFATTSLE